MDNKLWVFAALLIVLVLIGAAAWLVRKFSSGNAGAGANRGRMPRLAVIDATAVDNRRRLVLVRRDNVEHLIMIGGPTDVVVEPNIVRGMAQREQAQQRGPAGTELPGRTAPLPDTNWQDTEAFDHREPAMHEPPQHAARAPYPDEVRRPSPPIVDYDAAPSFAPEPSFRNEPAPRAISRSERAEPMPRMPRATEIPAKAAAPRAARQQDALPSSADQNLADMAQRLEAALRRPGSELRLDGGEARTPAFSAADRVGAPAANGRSAPRAPAAPAPKPAFDNLEDEMASLLGRPKPPA